ncbi:potassium transporter [Acuticoccus sediminis]|uniref:Potassium transporter n=1 Tax=Acuticoccus sediminis TaxID=2184697 RepID=A0A8B2NT72_9HYPH|nr:FAD-dependent oxidoreductase [Acuticoccus sediminis]RAI00664.1 potassium transporter [Acuticoccus sediminis]
MADVSNGTVEVETCDLCIIGAGIAGLNALFVAAQYLASTDKVILIDRKGGPGGMWTEIYDYARLHQPHPAFTVGDMSWGWSRPAHYLSTGAEVAAHLAACFTQLRDKVNLVDYFAHTATRCDEVSVGEGRTAVRVEIHPNDAPERRRIITAKKVIRAIGFDIPALEPLPLQSNYVLSTTPQRLSADGVFDTRAPVYIVGGGKTGMDTAHALVERTPRRRITLLNGNGTVFANRDILAPAGMRTWWRGRLFTSIFRDLAMRFDGTNADDVFDHFRTTSSVSLDPSDKQFFFGILSEAEVDELDWGLDQIVNDYLEDVVDGDRGTMAVLRGGGRLPVVPGSIFVNCTGHMLRHNHPYEPYLSERGAVLSITPRSMTHFLTSMAGYLLSHLFLSDTLKDAELYALDGEALRRQGGHIYQTSLFSLTFLNTIIAHEALPFRAMNRCGLDFDRIYPLHRRVPAMIDVKRNGSRYVKHCRTSLDRVRDTYGVQCGPLKMAA